MAQSSPQPRVRSLKERAADMRDALDSWLRREHAGQDVPQQAFAARVRALTEAWIPEDRDSLRSLIQSEPSLMQVSVQDVARLAVRVADLSAQEGAAPLLVWVSTRLGIPQTAAYERVGAGFQPSTLLKDCLDRGTLRWQDAFQHNPEMARSALQIEEASPHEMASAMVRRLAVRSLVRELGPVDEIRQTHNQAVERERRHARDQIELEAPAAQPFDWEGESWPGQPETAETRPLTAHEAPRATPVTAPAAPRGPVRLVQGFDVDLD